MNFIQKTNQARTQDTRVGLREFDAEDKPDKNSEDRSGTADI